MPRRAAVRPGPVGTGPAYNVFRNGDLLCAVPEDRPVPRFLGREWTYLGRAGALGTGFPQGFDHAAASAGVRFNGFHLFQSWGAWPRMAAHPGRRLSYGGCLDMPVHSGREKPRLVSQDKA